MRWLFRPGDNVDDAPRIVTLQDAPSADESSAGSPVQFLPGGGLQVSVSNAVEAREALIALQRRQRDLLASATRETGAGVVAVGGTVRDGVRSGGRRVRHASSRVVRRFRFRSGSNLSAGTTGDTVSDVLDAALLATYVGDGVIDSIKLIGAAAHAIADAVPDIDLSDFDFLSDLNF
jgi:hypothetical protein